MEDTREIAVVGVGSAQGVPDRCVLSLTLNVAAETSGAALAGVTQLASQVVGVLLTHEVLSSETQTTQLSLQDFHDNEKRKVTARIASYGLSVNLAGLTHAGPLLTELAELAGDSLQARVRLEMSNPTPFVNAARRAAVADALDRAEQLADAAGLRLGKIVAIDEGAGIPGDSPRRMSRSLATTAALPVEGGTSSVTVEVIVRLAIAD
jgi:uncharacterized protein YggE